MIESIKILPNSLRVRFKNKYEENYPNIWLRDHIKDERNWDKRNHQRKTFTASLDLNIQIKEAKVIGNGNCIDILWADMDSSVQYSYEYLFNNILNNKTNHNSLRLWNKNEIKEDIYINFQNLLKDDGFKIFLKKLYSLGFCVITNCETKLETVGIIANKIGYVRQSIFEVYGNLSQTKIWLIAHILKKSLDHIQIQLTAMMRQVYNYYFVVIIKQVVVNL